MTMVVVIKKRKEANLIKGLFPIQYGHHSTAVRPSTNLNNTNNLKKKSSDETFLRICDFVL